MQRSTDFITYPGTGMWMVFGTYEHSTRFELFRGLSREQIKALAENPSIKLYWIDQGAGANTLLRIRMGAKSSSGHEVTPSILKRYLKE